MAYERASDSKIKGDSLDVFVSNLSKAFEVQVALRNAEDELRFNTLVLEDNLGLDQQLQYRKDQLKRITGDPTERARVRGEISNLKQRIEQKTFADPYLEQLVDFESGISSIDNVIGWLESQRATTVNLGVRDKIDEQLRTHKGKKFELTQQLLENQTRFAANDKSISVIDEQIEKISGARATAILAGNDTLVSSFDLQLQILNKAKTEGQIEKDIKNFAVSSITGYSTATGLLDAYNSKVVAADDSSGPITVGGVTYASAREFWTYKRDSYVSDSGATGFFNQLNNEINTDIKVLGSKNQLDKNALASASSKYDTLSSRPELAGYESRIAAFRQDTLQTGANLIGNKIVNEFAVKLDVGKAVADLSALNSLGVATDEFHTKIITSAAATKSNQVSSILAAAQTAMQNDPSLTAQAALDQAIKAGAGLVLSPEQLTSMSESEIASDIASKTEAESFEDDPRTTIPGVAPTAGAPEGGGNFSNYTIRSGDTLSAIAARNNTTVSQLAALNNIQNPNLIRAGSTIKLPSASSTPAPSPTPTPSPAPSTPTSTSTPTTTPAPTTPPPAPKSSYTGGSIADYLSSIGEDPSYAARSKLAASKGITGYQGTASQNTQLLKTLRGF